MSPFSSGGKPGEEFVFPQICAFFQDRVTNRKEMQMEDLTFFDVNCQIGTPMCGCLEFASKTEDLIKELDFAGISKAVVSHVNTPSGGAVLGNHFVNRALREDTEQRLIGCWCILPECLNENIPSGENLCREMKEKRIGMLEICPVSHRWVPHRITIGKLFDMLAEHKILIKTSVQEMGSWNEFYNLVERFPRNRFLITNTNLWGCDRYIRPLFETTDKVFMELSEYWVAEGIANLVERYGADHLLYGSGYPSWTHVSQMMNIKHAKISESDRRKIASGNLERLLEEAQL